MCTIHIWILLFLHYSIYALCCDELHAGTGRSAAALFNMTPPTPIDAVWREAAGILRLALPNCVASLTQITGMATLIFLGQFGTDALAGAGLGFMFCAVTGTSFIYGTGMGLGTLSSQAFGAKNYRRVGLLMQRQLVYQWLLCVPVMVLWLSAESILLVAGQPPRAAHYAGMFAGWQVHGLLAVPVLNSVNVFLQSQRVVRPSAAISLFTNFCITIPLSYVLTRPSNLGFVGAPFAAGCGQLCQAAALWLVAPRVIKHPCWIAWSRDALVGWQELIRLGMGGAIGLWAEWWAAELMVLLGGVLCSSRDDPEAACADVAVTVLLRNFGNAAIGLSWGFATAGVVRVGNLLGEGKPAEARLAGIIGGTLQVTVCATLAAFIIGFSRVWVAFFDLEPEAVTLLYRLMPFACFYWLGIALGCGALRSILISVGLVRFAAVVQLVAFYPIGTLCGAMLAFDKLGAPQVAGVIGLWIGCDLGYVFMVAALLVYYLRIDWPAMSRLAQDRARKDMPGHNDIPDGGEETDETGELLAKAF